MSELSDEASESEQLGVSLSLWLGESLVRPEELDVPLDLHTACSIGQYDVVAECIKKREVNLDGKNIGGWTPLMYAAYIGHDNIANLLLEAGVNVNATTAKGLTPLMLAASCGNESIAYFLLQHGAELELKDSLGWTALLHCTSTGHQQMVKFLLDNKADANVKEPGSGFTPLMEAAASGHEIILQYLLDHKVKVDDRNAKGETARAIAMMYGYTKIVSLIDSRSPRSKPGHFEDLSSSEDSDSAPPRIRPSRNRAKGISIHDGPQAIAKFRVGGPSKLCEPPAVPPGYMTFRDIGEQTEGLCYRDVTSPINELDGQSSSSRDDSPFFDNDMPTMRSSSSSSEGPPHVVGLNWEGSVESNEDSDQCKKSSSRRVNKGYHSKGKGRHGISEAAHSSATGNCGIRPHVVPPPSYSGPKDLADFLEQIGFSKYLPLLVEQDIDLRIFLTLTENDLKEIGITLFGPKRKMTSGIARWHSSARPPSDALEQAYADQLEAEMQEMAIQLHKHCEEAESLQSQVSQEKELRTVMEGCLMEDKMAWRRVHTELVENHRLTQDMSATLAKARTCCAELLSGFTTDGNGSAYTGVEDKAKDDTSVKAADGLTCSSVVEIIKKLDSYEDQLAGTLKTVQQSLRRLSAPEKVSDSWERP
ncbi:ankyrin repeat and SAM domain-containing protein 3 isoform X2 [Hippoglossus hippoglossus]|uniref:ankyrin repeat and SAM domain-containing protein 3 isoform X2 n=1 Tax=Hippoglossus hippoglossus TaxID=8267 RepID=UPI00148B5A79|nr:ankyrin repeat and SAM domain-containing protein 3 isoform X2 [Hippoglossus hippoglossus]